MKIRNMIFALLPAMLLAGCSKDESPKTDMSKYTPETPVVIDRTAFPKGVDVSWITQMEAEGEVFYDNAGNTTECMSLLKNECGVNSVRLRVWVNPQSGWCNIDDVLVKARRANALGLRLMIDFHFSDTWTDPSKQIVPKAWKDLSVAELKTAMTQHVNTMLTKLKTYGITPEWVQIGNETRSGMMYETIDAYDDADNATNYIFTDNASGHYTNGSLFAEYINTGYDAVKAVFPEAKVVVHIDSGDKLAYYTRIFGYLKEKGAKYDVMGISLYPAATGNEAVIDDARLNDCLTAITTASATYGKQVMICEIGAGNKKGAEMNATLTKLLNAAKSGTPLAGIFYWEPQAPAGYNGGYQMGCFLNGKPTEALKAFLK